jgi:hypothetical protein
LEIPENGGNFMNLRMLIGSLALVGVTASAVPVAAQDVTAEVRTWSGQSLRLSQPSLEVFYTILRVEEHPGGSQGPGATGGAPGSMGSGVSSGSLIGTEVRGSVQNMSRLFGGGGPEPMQGNRQADTVSIQQAGVERRIPLETIRDLAFKREQVANSTFPPYVAPTHFRHAVSLLLIDGTRVDGDYVNLGTAILRGLTPQGRVDIPWQEIEVVRFSR